MFSLYLCSRLYKNFIDRREILNFQIILFIVNIRNNLLSIVKIKNIVELKIKDICCIFE